MKGALRRDPSFYLFILGAFRRYAPSGSRAVDTKDTSQLGTLGAERLADAQMKASVGSPANKTVGGTAVTNPKEAITKAITSLCKYKTADAGVVAMKTLLIYLKNLINKPEDAKYVLTQPKLQSTNS